MIKTPRAAVAVLASLAALACGASACSGSSTSSSASRTGTATARLDSPAPTSSAPTSSTQPAVQVSPSPVGPAVTLRLGTDDGPAAPGGQQITHFARVVSDLSGGAITIEPVWHADGYRAHFDQAVATMVQSGKLDLGMVPSRAWDELGVTSLTALTAPFLITTDTLTNAVVTDDQLDAQLVSGLPAVGVSALGLIPEGLRHPFGFQHLLGGAADYQGGEVRAPYSGTTVAMFAALGATTDDGTANAASMIGAESSYRLSPAGTATGNVTFFPKINVLTLGDATRTNVSADQLAVLQHAADATRDWAVSSRPTDAKAAATFCRQGGKIGAATAPQIASLTAATRPVVDQLREDSLTAKAIREIRQLAVSDPPSDSVTSCAESEAPATVSAALDGTYSFTVTAKAMRAAGVHDEDLLDENAGAFVMTFASGTWSESQVYSVGPKAGQTYEGTGSYTLDGSHLKILWSHEPGDWNSADVAVAPDGSLTFHHLVDGSGNEFLDLDRATFTTWKKRSGG